MNAITARWALVGIIAGMLCGAYEALPDPAPTVHIEIIVRGA